MGRIENHYKQSVIPDNQKKCARTKEEIEDTRNSRHDQGKKLLEEMRRKYTVIKYNKNRTQEGKRSIDGRNKSKDRVNDGKTQLWC